MKVSELLTGPEKWCQEAMARNASGSRVPTSDSTACQWCLAGALVHCYGDDRTLLAVVAAMSRHVNRAIGHWNDAPGRTFEDVRQLIEELDI